MSGAAPDPSSWIREADWRQGDIISVQATNGLLGAAIDQQPSAEQTRLVVLSQDCDLVADIGKEPFVELIGATLVGKPDPSRQNGRNPRSLDLLVAGAPRTTLRFSIHDRFRVPKRALQAIRPAVDVVLADDERCTLRRWVARRYTRAAFPDALNRRLDSQRKALDRLFKSDGAKLVTAIFVATSEEELAVGMAYDLKVRITAAMPVWNNSDAQRLLARFEQELSDVLSGCDGVALVEGIETMPEDDFTIGLLRVYKRLDVDYRSLPEDADASPSDQVDTP
jgi:hypothetical protein